MKSSDGKSGGREFMSIILLSMMVKVSDTTPALLYQAGLTAAWLIPLLSLLIIAGPLLLLQHLLKRYNVGLIELLYKLTGRYVGFIIGMSAFTIMFWGTVVNSRSYADIVNFMFYPKTPLIILYTLLIAASCYIASKGLETLGRTSWVIIPYVIGVYLILVALVRKDIELANLAPYMGPGFGQVAVSSFKYSSIFAEVFLLSIFYPCVRSDKEYRYANWLGLGTVVLLMMLFLIIFVAVFDFHSTRKEAFPFQHLTRFADIGPYIQHIEALFLGFWVMAGVVHFGIYIYIVTAILGQTLKLDKWEPLLLPMSGLILFTGMLPENITATLLLSRERLLFLASLFFIVLPLLLSLLNMVRRRSIST
ncbi:GerAB/ArcD/ProY family transporter [Paenibacillus sp. YYML68]|uniref:GerAB/ArcD/ProY family transporter n=1 Tax=Paenibacillus sp. YYML68 TaxID=2909250 RepID=UPI00249145D1|nr:GerAB/ArcD/ProY family transporter [Paenibacillus sp. YYML68]